MNLSRMPLQKNIFHIALSMITAFALLSCAVPKRTFVQDQFDRVKRMDEAAIQLPDRTRGFLVATVYDLTFTPAYLDSERSDGDAHDLVLLFDAAHVAAFASIHTRYIQDMLATLAVLDKRHQAPVRLYAAMYEMLVKARMFDAAKELARKYTIAGIEPLPNLPDPHKTDNQLPAEWVVDSQQSGMTPMNVDLRRDPQIVVIAHPLCHFSRAAMQEIETDPTLSRVFDKARWLAPQDGRLSLDVIRDWNHDHPRQQVAIAIERDKWPMFDRWSTPTFYFLSNGVVKRTVQGWPKQGRRDELIAAAREIGLLR